MVVGFFYPIEHVPNRRSTLLVTEEGNKSITRAQSTLFRYLRRVSVAG